ncbi:hypothetical protein C8R46DRAFT_1188145, partial [Mycena filopes]
MEKQKRVPTTSSGKKTKLVGSGEQLWPAVNEKAKFEIKYIKTHTLGWTVGPCDF